MKVLYINGNFYYDISDYISVPVEYDEKGVAIKWEEILNPLIPNDINELKKLCVETIKIQAHKELQKTDWCVIKCQEFGISITEKYPDIAQKRQQIRNWSNSKEEEILQCSTLEELLNIDLLLPENLKFDGI